MTDLENQLRDMLHERARDVTTLPAHLEHLDRPDEPHRPQHARTWLIAASVVAMLAVAGGAVALDRSHTHRSAPGHSGTPTITDPTPSPSSPHIPRLLDPMRIALTVPADYRVIAWSSRPGYRQVSLRPVHETGVPAGSNGGTSATAFVTIWDEGHFDGNDPSWRRTTFAGRPAYLGKALLAGGSHEINSLIFTTASGSTVLVQGDTSRTSGEQALRRLAATVRPDQGTDTPVPFRLTSVPSGVGLASIEDELAAGYSLDVQLVGAHRTVELLLRKQRGFSGLGLDPKLPPRTVAGRPGVFDSAQATAAVQITDTLVLQVSAFSKRGSNDVPDPAAVRQVIGGLQVADTILDSAIP